MFFDSFAVVDIFVVLNVLVDPFSPTRLSALVDLSILLEMNFLFGKDFFDVLCISDKSVLICRKAAITKKEKICTSILEKLRRNQLIDFPLVNISLILSSFHT